MNQVDLSEMDDEGEPLKPFDNIRVCNNKPSSFHSCNCSRKNGKACLGVDCMRLHTFTYSFKQHQLTSTTSSATANPAGKKRKVSDEESIMDSLKSAW